MIQLVALKKAKPTTEDKPPAEAKQRRQSRVKPSKDKDTGDKPERERKLIPGWKLSHQPPTRQSLATLSGCYRPSAENHRQGSVVLSHGVYPATINHRCNDPIPNTPYLIRAWLKQDDRQLSFEIISYDIAIPPDHFDHAIIAGYLYTVSDKSFKIAIRPSLTKIAPFTISICGKSKFERGSVVRVGCLITEKGLLAIASQDPRLVAEKFTQPPKPNLKNVEIEKLTDANMEITLKITELPKSMVVKNGWHAFHLDCDGRVVSVTVKPKQWKKLEDAQANFPVWIASITGKMGEATAKGFILEQAAIKTFERKPKEPKEPTNDQQN